MSFEKNFCPSPWFHMRINNSGSYEYCRWKVATKKHGIEIEHNIKRQSVEDYFQNTLSPIRQSMLDGKVISDDRVKS